MNSLLFFFSSRRRHTRLVSDWSSDVCSSDLYGRRSAQQDLHRERARAWWADLRPHQKQTPQSCPWGVIACSTSCALEPDASETKLLLGGPNERPRARVRAWGRRQPPAAGLSRVF